MTTDPTTRPNQPARATESPLSRPGSPKADLHPSGTEIGAQGNSDVLAAIFTERDREVLGSRAALLLALARADGQFWESIAEATPHTAEVMYGAFADVVESLIAARVDAAFIDGTHVIGDKVIRLAQANAILARANGRSEERRWLDLIHALEADLALIDRQENSDD